MLPFTELTTEIYDKYNYLDAILTEYEAHGETNCREYKMFLKLWRRVDCRWQCIRKKCERFSRLWDADFDKTAEKVAKYREKSGKYRDKR